MRRDQAILSVLSFAACLAGGALECRHEPDSLVEQHGKELYDRMCAVCHGSQGEGYRADDAPALSHPDFLASASDPYLREAIANGRMGSTMSAWGIEHGGPLVRGDVDALVSYLRSWETRPRAKLEEGDARGDAARGEGTFGENCARCHGKKAVGGPAPRIGDTAFLMSASNGYLRYAIAKGRTGTTMPAFADTLGPSSIEDVVAFLRTFQERSPRAFHGAAARPPPLPLGPVPLNPAGPEPVGFNPHPATTPAAVIKAQLDRKAKMAVLDARAPSDYAREHIAGAVSVPFYDPDPYFAQLPKDAWLVCYCACPHAESGQLAQKLSTHGFAHVTVLDEGLGFWKSHGFGTHVGLEP